MQRRIFMIRFAAVSGLSLLAGCGSELWPRFQSSPHASNANPKSPSPDAASSISDVGVRRDFRVAMLLPGSKDDQGWSTTGYQALMAIGAELGAETLFTENLSELDVPKMAQVIRHYAQDSVDFIIGHGDQFQDPLIVVAEEFPRVKFGITNDYEGNNRNLGGLSFRYGELGYLAGVTAAIASKRQNIGMICGQDTNTGKQEVRGFERGAKVTSPNIKMRSAYVGSWRDPDTAAQIAAQFIEADIDVIVALADLGNKAIFQAAEAAGIYAIGWQVDQYQLSPPTIITSCVQDAAVLMVEAAKQVRIGKWNGKKYRAGIAEGAQYLAPIRHVLSTSEMDQVHNIEESIRRGEIDFLGIRRGA